MFGIGHWELLCIATTILLLGGVAVLVVVAITKSSRQSAVPKLQQTNSITCEFLAALREASGLGGEP
jgi:hypothetical protein